MAEQPHVLVVGGGNAALCAALSAVEEGARVTLLERAPESARGGNSAFTAGSMRVAFNGVDDLLTLMPDMSQAQLENTDFGSYPASQFFADLARLTADRTDPELASVLVDESLPTLQWMRSKGVRFLPMYGRQAFEVDGHFTFWGGLIVEASGGGPGLVESLTKAARAANVDVRYGARALALLSDDSGVHGVRMRENGKTIDFPADAVILACGGFQANTEMRARYLGPSWDLAKVRGTMYNTGDGHTMALAVGASPVGNWSGCHAVGWELNAPEFGDLTVGDHFQKHSYPWSVMVNAHGKRFLDEGADFRNYTYAKYGSVILQQPGHFAWQIFDGKVLGLLRDEYRIRQVTKVRADSLEELASRLDGVDADAFLREIHEYNNAVDENTPFNPNVRDGRAARGLAVPKSNWANTISEPPFEAYAVTCGITFTFGGLRINKQAQILDTDMNPIPGLFAAGEIVGGIFYFNYPGGSGLTNGSVFGRIAGRTAASAAGATPAS